MHGTPRAAPSASATRSTVDRAGTWLVPAAARTTPSTPRPGPSKSRNAVSTRASGQAAPTARASARVDGAARGSRLPCATRTSGRLRGMDAALRLVEQRPATGPRVLARRGPAGARPAADRGVPLLDERVDRHVVPGDVRLHVGLGPLGQRRDLHLAAAGVETDDRRVGPGRSLGAAQPGGPRVVVLHRPVQRLDLADPAALVRLPGGEPGAE